MSYDWTWPGNKVVCVDASRRNWVGNWLGSEAPVEGAVYTIRRSLIDEVGDPVLHLVELERDRRAKALFGANCGYHVERFRPLVSDSGELETAFYYGKNRHAKQPHKEPA